jgi:hypothetical protein
VALYRIERPFGGPLSEEEIEAAAFRSLACLRHYTGITWLRSYLDRERWQFTCYYEAESPELIREHARVARIPCESITEVVEYLPEAYR